MSFSESIEPSQIYNVTLTTPGTTYSQLLPDKTKNFSMQCEDDFIVRYSFENAVADPGAGTRPYMTLKVGGFYNSPEKMGWGGGTIYFGADEAGIVMQILVWEAV